MIAILTYKGMIAIAIYQPSRKMWEGMVVGAIMPDGSEVPYGDILFSSPSISTLSTAFHRAVDQHLNPDRI